MSEFFDLCQKPNKEECREAEYTCTQKCMEIWLPENEASTPTLNSLKNLMSTKSEPVRRLQPKPCAQVAEYSDYTKAEHLIKLAVENEGRLTLAMARYELADKTRTLQDIYNLIASTHPHTHIEQRISNTLLITASAKRKIFIPQTTKQLPDRETNK